MSAALIVPENRTDTLDELTRGLDRPELTLPNTPKVSVIVPTKNEAKNLAHVFNVVHALMSGNIFPVGSIAVPQVV